ncbi:unnamed protein product [Parnassius apollo]|uniref:(apollo) hypothetical protein n=1 Tax=Parnassius apollo TaxID=110799 RepID=A0A8S3WGB6_PARAO|nr:unnamed protein product [Parnassius apollo]
MLKNILLVTFLLEVITAQYQFLPFSPKAPIELAISPIVEALTGRVSSRIPNPSTPLEEIILCRNLAAKIESAALAKLKQNALKRPVFGQVVGPLLDEIAMICRCPVCHNTNSYSTTNSVALSNSPPSASNTPNIVLFNSPVCASSPNINQIQFSCD